MSFYSIFPLWWRLAQCLPWAVWLSALYLPYGEDWLNVYLELYGSLFHLPRVLKRGSAGVLPFVAFLESENDLRYKSRRLGRYPYSSLPPFHLFSSNLFRCFCYVYSYTFRTPLLPQNVHPKNATLGARLIISCCIPCPSVCRAYWLVGIKYWPGYDESARNGSILVSWKSSNIITLSLSLSFFLSLSLFWQWALIQM